MTKGIGAAVVAVQEIARWSGGWPIKEQHMTNPMTNTERVALLPCPFCGPKDDLSGEWPQLFEHRSDCISEWSVRCGCCSIEVGGEYQEEVIADWNTRTIPNVDELVEALERIFKIADDNYKGLDGLQTRAVWLAARAALNQEKATR